VFARLKRIIDVRGCFWHLHPGCIESHIPKTRRSYWKPKLLRNQQRDEENAMKLRKVLTLAEEGERIDPRSVIQLPDNHNLPVLPDFERSTTDPFVRRVQASGKKWVILTNRADEPLLALDSEGFLQGLLFGGERFNANSFCHRPIVVTDPKKSFAQVLPELKVHATHAEDDVIDHDIILLWARERRVITGSDILGRLLRGIVHQTHHNLPVGKE
jgi:hypothetical protein